MNQKTRKLMWSVPLIAAVAVIGALAIFMTQAPNAALAQTSSSVPGIPMNLKADATSPTSIDLSWDAPTSTNGDNPDGYRVDYSEDGLVWFELVANHNSTEYTHDGLMERTTVHYRVFAHNSTGTSGASATDSATTKMSVVPDAPTSLSASPATEVSDDGADHTQIALTWTAPDNPDGAPVKEYIIQVSSDGRNYGNLLKEPLSTKDAGCDTDSACTYTHKKLLENTQRWYRVYAKNSVGTSKASISDDAKTAPGDIPGEPRNLRAGLNKSGRIVLYWDKPEGTEPAGAPITGYYVLGYPTGTTLDTATSRLYNAGQHTSLVIDGTVARKFRNPTSTQTWSFRVGAINRVVDRNLADGEIEAADADADWTSDLTVDPTKDDTEVAAMVGRPVLTGKKVSNVNGGRTSISLEWKAAGSDTNTAYRLESSTDSVDWEIVPEHTPVTATEVTDGSLIAGTTYHYRVFASHGSAANPGTSVFTEASREVSVMTSPADRPDAPVLDTAVPASEEKIELVWTPPQEGTDDAADPGDEELGYGKITAYMVEVSEDGTDWSQLVTISDPKTTLEYTWDGKALSSKTGGTSAKIDLIHAGLSQGQTRYYRVSTVNNAPGSKAISVPSNGLTATTHGSLKADSPGGLVVKAVSSSAIELLWTARAPNIVAAPVTGYKIESSPLNAKGDDCAEQWSTLVADTMSTTTSHQDKGLMPETGRCYRVFGINDVATSTGFVGYGDAYPATKDNDAMATTLANAAPATGTAPTVEPITAGMTAKVQSSITDADLGDTLTWDWMSDATAVATVMKDATDGSMAIITAVAAGDANIMVTATDAAGASASETIMVTVVAANNDPMAMGTIPNMDMVYRRAMQTVDASMYFEDEDEDDTLTYSVAVEPDDDSIAKVEITGEAMNMVTVTGVGIGKATVTVSASDGYEGGTDATQTFMVMVVNQNPTASDIPAVSLVEGTSSDAIDLSMYFMDADAMDTLTYGNLMSSDANVATSSISDDMLTIMAHNNGEGADDAMATITVEANDGNGGTVSGTIAVTVTAAPLGTPTNVMAQIDDQDPGVPGITVTWTDGANSDAHWVGLYDVLNNMTYRSHRVAGDPSAMTYTFPNVAPGTYLPAVISTAEGFTPLVNYARLANEKPKLTVIPVPDSGQ